MVNLRVVKEEKRRLLEERARESPDEPLDENPQMTPLVDRSLSS